MRRFKNLIFLKNKYLTMTCTTNRPHRVVTTTPHFGNIINEFLNTAVGEVVQKTEVKKTNNPAVNVQEYDDRLVLQLAIPGIDKNDVRITIDADVLKVEAKSEAEKEVTYRLREFNYGGFVKNFKLPEFIDVTAIEAKFDRGVLTLSLGKKKEAIPQPPRSIEIK
jgi:HSP20 family protein